MNVYTLVRRLGKNWFLNKNEKKIDFYIINIIYERKRLSYIFRSDKQDKYILILYLKYKISLFLLLY